MKSRIISVDLAKDVFEVAVANGQYRILERIGCRARNSAAFSRPNPRPSFSSSRAAPPLLARHAEAAGHQATLSRHTTSNPIVDAARPTGSTPRALLEAHRCEGIKPVPCARSSSSRSSSSRVRDNGSDADTAHQRLARFPPRTRLRHPEGAVVAQRRARQILDDDASIAVESRLQPASRRGRHPRARCQSRRDAAKTLTKTNINVQRLQTVSGIGLLTSTAMVRVPDRPITSRWPTLRSWIA